MPSSKQTRRSISVRGTTYDTLRRFCQDQNRSMSDVVEEQLARLLSAKPVVAKPAARQRPTVAPRIVRAAPPPSSPSTKLAGRPAPIPAREIVQPRIHAPKGDYRNIDF
jgi:hypothetical protein